jgi:hypothetical protein
VRPNEIDRKEHLMPIKKTSSILPLASLCFFILISMLGSSFGSGLDCLSIDSRLLTKDLGVDRMT